MAIDERKCASMASLNVVVVNLLCFRLRLVASPPVNAVVHGNESVKLLTAVWPGIHALLRLE